MCRKLMFLACLIFVLGLFLTSAAQADLVGWWRLDDGSGTTAADSSGNGNDGTIQGDPQWVAGKVGGALEFDGDGDYVDCGNDAVFDITEEITLSVWINANDILNGEHNCWLGKGDNTYAIKHQSGNNLEFFVYDGSWHATNYTTDIASLNGDWHHMAGTFDGTELKFYLDGEMVLSSAFSGTIGTATHSVTIGENSQATGRFFDGMLDDARIYNEALSQDQIQADMKGAGFPLAFSPTPPDGALYSGTFVTMSWKPGDFAVSHDVYMGDNFDDVNDGLGDTFRGNLELKFTYLVAGFPTYPFPDGLVPGTTYYWRIDEVNDANAASPWKGEVWSFTVPSSKAYEPIPADGLEFIAPDVTLSWTGGLGSVLHNVFFGESFEEVDAATVGIPLPFTNYTPSGLELEKTYYWRVDENDSVEIHKGDVWSFKTLPDIPISDPDLVGWWKLDEGAGLTAVDWSGNGNHGTLMNGANWVDAYDGGGVEFDQGDDYVDTGYTTDLPIWTISAWVISPDGPSGRTNTGPIHRESNFQIDWDHTDPIFRGAAAVNAGGWFAASFGPLQANTWYHLAATYDGSELIAYTNGILITSNAAPSGDPAAESATLKLGRHAVAAQYFGGIVDDVRVYSRVLTLEEIQQTMRGDPYVAWNASPGNGATPFVRDALPLTWSAGDNASQHDVYYGTDRDTVNDADTTTADIYRGRQVGTSYSPPEGVEWGGGPYYWRIDQVNTDATITKGRIWRFAVADFILVDDFETYDIGNKEIWWFWKDGLGFTNHPTEPANPGNGTGAMVGDDTSPTYTENSIVHGGNQSMPYWYDNNKQGFSKYSEAGLTLTDHRDWTEEGVAELSLWFRGNPASVGSFVEGPVGTYTMTGSGADIWAVDGVEADEFHYAFKTLTGAGSIQAQVLSVDNTHVWAKAGVMIRETLNPDSAHAMMVVTPSSGVAFQRRPDTGGTSVGDTTAGITAPYWVKIERDLAGNFRAYSSADGSTWTMLGFSEPIQMGTNVYIGLAVTSHDAAQTCQAVFSNVTTTGTVGALWTNQDIGIASNAAEPLYVAVSNSAGAPAVVVHDEPAAAQIDTWTEWVIPLQAFADQGITLTNVDKIAIGLGTQGNMTIPGGSGKMYFDDIRLTRSAPEPEPEPEPQP